MSHSVLLGICALVGLVVGSFLNVVVWRVPRHESIVRPGSHCPNCETELSPFENVPVLAWLALRGRCRHCQARISARYPLVEILTAALWVGIGQRFGATWEVPAYCVLAAGLVALSLIDLDHFLLPNRVLYPVGFMFAGLMLVPAAVEPSWTAYLRGVEGGAAAFLVFLGLFLGFLLGAVVGSALIALKLRTRKQPVPFGPFMAAGALTAIYAGTQLLDLYRGR